MPHPFLAPQERRAVGLSLVVAPCAFLVGLTPATVATLNAAPTEQVALLGP